MMLYDERQKEKKKKKQTKPPQHTTFSFHFQQLLCHDYIGGKEKKKQNQSDSKT